MRVARGIYHDRDQVRAAVRALLDASVPAHLIRLDLRHPGRGDRTVPIADEAGVVDGAVRGATWGAVLGALLLFVVTATVALGAGDGPWAANPFSAAARGALWGGAAGVTLGAIIGIGRWRGLRDLDAAWLDGGHARISVESDDLADTVLRVLRESGAADARIDPGR